MSSACNPLSNLSESVKLIVNTSAGLCYSSRSFASPTLQNFSEDEILKALRDFIEQRTAEAKNNLISLLSQQITVAYLEGADRAAKEVGDYESIGMAGLDPVIESLAPRLDEVFSSLSGELTYIINSGIKKNRSYVDVQRELQSVLKSGWGDSVTFDSVGKTRRYVHVNPDGSLEWKEKVIKKKITLPTDTYADTLSRTQMKSAYAYGHQQKYIESGREGWVYLCVSDERSRPHHVALHGRVFIFGTEESDMALEVMKDYNCRCRQKAWFNDKKLDTDPEVYEKQRKQWAKNNLDEIYLNKGAEVVSSIPFGKSITKEEMISLLSEKVKKTDSKFLLEVAGLKEKDQIVKTFDTLKDNFTHNGVGHAMKHVKEAKGEYGISDLLYVKSHGTLLGKTNKGDAVFGKSEMGVPLAVFIKDDNRIGTAYKCGTKCQKWLNKNMKN